MSVLERHLKEAEHVKARPYTQKMTPQQAQKLRQNELNRDLTAILHGHVPRQYGELPETMGKYRRLCPHTDMYDSLMKLKKHYIKEL